MQCDACQRWPGHVCRAGCINRGTKTALSEHLQQFCRKGLTRKKGTSGRGFTQSEINNSTLIHHKPVITTGPPLATTFHSEKLQRVGGMLWLSMFMKCLGISIFKLVLHSISISFRSTLKFIFSLRPELTQQRNSQTMRGIGVQ